MKGYTTLRLEDTDKVFFTADQHFFHDAIIQHCNRPFGDVPEMNRTLIDNWNSIVRDDGLVFVLGDMFYKSGTMILCRNVMTRLNGHKVLIAGNHDLHSRTDYRLLGFDDARDYLELLIGWRRIVLSHYPLLERNGFYRGAWHLHGHTHGRSSHFSSRVLDVGVDVWNYRPVSLERVSELLEDGMEKDKADMAARGDCIRHRPYTFARS